MGRTATPYAGAFFAMVSIGGVIGAAATPFLAIVEGLATASFDISGIPIESVFGFFIGLAVAGSGGGPAIGLHALAERTVPALRVAATALGAFLGPVLLMWAITGSPWSFPFLPKGWVLILPASALTAVLVTRPLRAREKRHFEIAPRLRAE